MDNTHSTLVAPAEFSVPRPNNCSRMLERARQSIAGGDSSTMRVLPYHIPLVADRGQGARLWDVDGKEYLDLNMAYGPLLLGHRPPRVIEAVVRQITERGSQLGFPTEITVRVAEKIKQLYPSMELLRFANSGTEACASAIRLARAYTGRRKLVMFEGHYHGWSEAVFNRYHDSRHQRHERFDGRRRGRRVERLRCPRALPR
jgi:glutamate-1-semialdehyde 2,1-aminomutase